MPEVKRLAAPVVASVVKPTLRAAVAATVAVPRNLRGAVKPTQTGEGALTLATVLSEPVKLIEECHWLLYGDTKIGKTSLASMFPRAHFLFFEPGGKGLSLHDRYVSNWRQFVKYVDLLRADTQFKTVVIDIADKCYERCFEFVCSRDGMTHPNDKAWGEGWKAVRKEFEGQIERLAERKSIVFISHADDREFQTRTGWKYTKIVPSMSGQARDFIGGFVDVMGFYGYFGDNRYLTIRGSDEVDAGTRLKTHFRTADGKRKVHSIPMFNEANEDYDEEDAYRALVTAFENKQKGTGKPEDAATLANIPAKPKPKK